MKIFRLVFIISSYILLVSLGNQQSPVPPGTEKNKEAWFQLLNKGYTLLLDGNIANSTDAYSTALLWTEQYPEIATKEEILEYVLKPLGNNYTRLGDYEQALFIQKKALTIAIQLKDNNQLASAYSNLATTVSSMGNAEQSLVYCTEGLKVANLNSPLHGLLLAEQAGALHQLQQIVASKIAVERSIKILQKHTAYAYWLLMVYQQAGDIYSEQPAKALEFYKKAYTLQQQLLQQNGAIRNRERAKLFYRFGKLYSSLHQYDTSSYWLDQCISVLLPGKTFSTIVNTDLYGENTLLDALFVKGSISEASHKTDEALHFYQLCFATEKNLRKEYITGTAKERSVADSRSRYETAIDAAYTAWEKSGEKAYQNKMLQFIESGKAQLLLEELQQQSKDYVVNLKPDTIAYFTNSRNYLVRSFFTGKNSMYTIEMDNVGIKFVEKLSISPAFTDSIQKFTTTYFQTGARNMLNHPQSYFKTAYAIYQRLFSNYPLQKNRNYILLPDGVLSTLPIDALVTDSNYSSSVNTWPFVIKQASISYAYSLQTLHEQTESKVNGKGFTGLFIAENKRQQPVLNAVLQEQAGIASIIPNGNWLINEQATYKAFRHSLETSAVVHISSHAFASKDSLSSPHIQLADTAFYLHELKSMSKHASMIILSACRTGDGRLITGEGVQSMARAFTANGTKAVVAGWWNVNDETTSQLMQHFYRSLSLNNNTANALRDAKLKWLNDPNTAYVLKLPYYWAALNYQGYPDALPENVINNKKVFSTKLLLILGLIISSLCILLYWLRQRKSSSIPN